MFRAPVLRDAVFTCRQPPYDDFDSTFYERLKGTGLKARLASRRFRPFLAARLAVGGLHAGGGGRRIVVGLRRLGQHVAVAGSASSVAASRCSSSQATAGLANRRL